jgi:hypothetical protein
LLVVPVVVHVDVYAGKDVGMNRVLFNSEQWGDRLKIEGKGGIFEGFEISEL